jgi:ankyrin repeat protein
LKLIEATKGNDINMVKYLVDNKIDLNVDINDQDKHSRTALIYASYYNYKDIAFKLKIVHKSKRDCF